MWCRPMSSPRSSGDSRDGKRANLSRAGVDEHPGARLQRRARRAHIVDQYDHEPVHVGARSQRERSLHVGLARVSGKVRLRRPSRVCASGCRGSGGQMARDLGGLIETARPFSRSMQRNRHCRIRARQRGDAAHGQKPSKRTRQRSSPVILQRVDDGAERPVVLADGAACTSRHARPRRHRGQVTAFDLVNSPRRQGIAADVAERRREQS